jgi:hypothetical protein
VRPLQSRPGGSGRDSLSALSLPALAHCHRSQLRFRMQTRAHAPRRPGSGQSTDQFAPGLPRGGRFQALSFPRACRLSATTAPGKRWPLNRLSPASPGGPGDLPHG